MKTLQADQITDADRPFLMAVGHADGTVSLYYPGDTLPDFSPTPAQIAAADAVRVATQNNAQAARQYAKLVAMRGMTPAQLQVWVAANVVDLPSARDALLTLAVGQCLLMNATQV